MVLLDIIKKGLQGNDFRCRQVLPTSGHRSCSVWDVPDIKVSTYRRTSARHQHHRLCWIRVVVIVQPGHTTTIFDGGAELSGMVGRDHGGQLRI